MRWLVLVTLAVHLVAVLASFDYEDSEHGSDYGSDHGGDYEDVSLLFSIKVQQREMVFSLIASYPGQKERILNFFHVVPIFTELGQDLTHLAHKMNTHSDIFLSDRLKIVIAFCSLWGSDLQ
jgi:hypothetical protein